MMRLWDGILETIRPKTLEGALIPLINLTLKSTGLKMVKIFMSYNKSKLYDTPS